MMKRDKIELKKVLNPYSELVKSQCIFTDNAETTSKINTINFESNSKEKCKVNKCNKKYGRSRMRLHIGWHILKGHLLPDPSRCGFCGLSGHTLEIRPASGYGKNKSYIPWADCDYYFNFNFKKSYDEVVASNPCSNRPVKCDQCEGTFWTYNIKAHYVVSHPSITTENIPNYISENEKKAVLNMF